MKRERRNAYTATAIRIHAPAAQEVFVAGSFNAWDPHSIAMEREADGNWVATLDLGPGLHEYKFVVDGHWCCKPGQSEPDEECPGMVRNTLGTWNCAIQVNE